MTEFLTWKAAYYEPITAYTWFMVIVGGFSLIAIFVYLFYNLCNLVKWINRKFFTVDEEELDEIDYYENQNGKELL